MKYQPIEAKTMIHPIKNNRRLPFRYDLNLYRGCSHGCKYCYAIYSHKYLEDKDYFSSIYYKKNAVEVLEKQLSSPKWKRDPISLGGVTDSYQPIEKKLKLMPQVLKLMIKYQTPIIISTKSTLILRDIELIKELAEITTVNIAMTITCMDEKIREKIEPGSSPTMDRWNALLKIKRETKAIVGVHLMPIIPYFTDNYQNLDTIYRLASKLNADYILPGTMYLRGNTKPYFMNFVKEYDEGRYQKLKELYKNGSLPKEYKIGLYKVLYELKEKYHLSYDYMKFIKCHQNVRKKGGVNETDCP